MNNIELSTAFIRTSCRTAYDLQKLRIQTGNRIAGNFRQKLGITSNEMSEEDLETIEKGILERLRASHRRITDAIVEATGSKAITRLRLEKHFKPDDLITEVGEMYMMDSYLSTLDTEERQFKDIERLLQNIPIYTEFLSKIPGIGPAISGVIVSEIDIHKAEYPSSLWAYCGLDVVDVIEFTKDGKKERLSIEQAMNYDGITTDGDNFFYRGVLCQRTTAGRTKQGYSMVKREYVNKNGESSVRNSITYSPFLKTKLLGVAATSMIKAAGIRVDGKVMGEAKRLKLAIENGFDVESVGDDTTLSVAVDSFLRHKGFSIERGGSSYVKTYYEYKNRLQNSERHKDKTPIHINKMALRYMIKQFLVDLYINWRKLEGLPVAPSYAEAKLNMPHGRAVDNKGKMLG